MNVNPPTLESARLHAERIRQGEEERAAAKGARKDARQTFERYAEQALEAARADEALREEARRRAERARGRWVPGDEPDEDEEEGVEEEPAADDPLDNPERRAAKAAWRSASTGGYLAL